MPAACCARQALEQLDCPAQLLSLLHTGVAGF